MDFVISLAHFCEIHGPTSILSTQLHPIDCATCFPCSTPGSEDVSKTSSFSSGFYESPVTTGSQHLNLSTPLLSPFGSPPTSPSSGTSGSYNPYFPDHNASRSHRRQGSIGGFSALSIDSEGESCDNCAFLVPKAMSQQLPNGAPGSPTKDGRGRHGSPILRTTQAIIAQGAPEDDENRQSSTQARRKPATPEDEDLPNPLTTSSTPSSQSGSALSSSSDTQQDCHTHLLTYVTTKQPIAQLSYSLLRRACIRALSNETLPKGSPSGSLYFGDPHAGYTIAYVFRVPDPRARGRRRIYALIALGGRDSWRVSQVMVTITKIFESIASQIIAMADRVLERESRLSSHTSRPPTSSTAGLSLVNGLVTPTLGLSTSPLSSSLPSAEMSKEAKSPTLERGSKSATASPTSRTVQLNDVSSFLSAKRVDTDGYPRVSREVMRAKGLAEIVGNENFFVELHAKFCVLLSSLIKEAVR